MRLKVCAQILEEGHLVDTWRELHPVSSPFELGDPAWTWRGSEHVTDKYHARGMRIDYCLVSRSLRAHVQEASILGRGVERWQGFFGIHGLLLLPLLLLHLVCP